MDSIPCSEAAHSGAAEARRREDDRVGEEKGKRVKGMRKGEGSRRDEGHRIIASAVPSNARCRAYHGQRMHSLEREKADDECAVSKESMATVGSAGAAPIPNHQPVRSRAAACISGSRPSEPRAVGRWRPGRVGISVLGAWGGGGSPQPTGSFRWCTPYKLVIPDRLGPPDN